MESGSAGWRLMNRVTVDAIEPRVVAILVVIAAKRFPDGAVAFDAGAERDLPHEVALADALLGFHVGQHVPDGAGRGVAESVERHARRLHVVLGERQILLDAVQDRLAARVDAEMVDRLLEVRDVGFAAQVENLARHEVAREFQLLRKR